MSEPEETTQASAETEPEEIEVVAHGIPAEPSGDPTACCILDLGDQT